MFKLICFMLLGFMVSCSSAYASNLTVTVNVFTAKESHVYNVTTNCFGLDASQPNLVTIHCQHQQWTHIVPGKVNRPTVRDNTVQMHTFNFVSGQMFIYTTYTGCDRINTPDSDGGLPVHYTVNCMRVN